MTVMIDIPDSLYQQTARRACEESTSVNEILLRGLEKELAAAERKPTLADPSVPSFARRKLLPEFARLQAEGAFRPKPGQRDITDIISDDRDGN